MNKAVGIIGLGKMGLPIAANLLEHGFPVIGYRRHMIDDFITMGGTPAHSCEDSWSASWADCRRYRDAFDTSQRRGTSCA